MQYNIKQHADRLWYVHFTNGEVIGGFTKYTVAEVNASAHIQKMTLR